MKQAAAAILASLSPAQQRQFNAAASEKFDQWMRRDDLAVPFPRDTLLFMCWLSRREWQAAYCLSLAYQMAGELNTRLPLGEPFRAIISLLQFENGHQWQGLKSDEDGELFPTQKRPVCEENMLSIKSIKEGIIPDYERHLEAAKGFLDMNRGLLIHRPVLEDFGAQMSSDLIKYKSVKLLPEVKEMVHERFKQMGSTVH